MTFGGNTRQAALFYASAAFFMCAMAVASVGGYRSAWLVIALFAAGLIAGVGSWAAGLPKQPVE